MLDNAVYSRVSAEIASALTQAILAKHNLETGASFRDEARQLGLSIKKDAPALRHGLLDGSIAPQQAVDDPAKYLDPEFKAEIQQIEAQNLKDSIATEQVSLYGLQDQRLTLVQLEPFPGRKSLDWLARF